MCANWSHACASPAEVVDLPRLPTNPSRASTPGEPMSEQSKFRTVKVLLHLSSTMTWARLCDRRIQVSDSKPYWTAFMANYCKLLFEYSTTFLCAGWDLNPHILTDTRT